MAEPLLLSGEAPPGALLQEGICKRDVARHAIAAKKSVCFRRGCDELQVSGGSLPVQQAWRKRQEK
jgi:hypothetical protein